MYHRAPLLIAILVGCSANTPKFLPPNPPSALARAPGIPAAQFDAIDRDAVAAGWRAVVAEAVKTLHDPGSRERLTEFHQMKASKDTPTTGREAAVLVLGDATTPGQVPTQYVLTDDDRTCKYQTASTAIVDGPSNTKFARTTLNLCTLDRAKQGPKTAAYACAINTAAHEMTHAVLTAKNEQIYRDDHHKRETTPLVSYAVGAVAQCLYLLRQGLLADSMFTSCVDQVGTTSFNPATCNETWLLTLRGIRPDVHAP